ncbi:hypothetical protein TIFTF001_035621 [Ficus carica]|uniref:PGG domain-containing protein n=1 Tax=Ficus carica TaxID=3494 RepID=A0AA88JBX4_FICCA|nr:hypothetical protein TIFTF001_035621 [Ficus carica]
MEYNAVFFKAIERGDWDTAKRYFMENRKLLKATYKSSNYTALHYAVASKKNEEIVEDMVEYMSEEDLERKESSCGWTALAKAIESGTASMVKCMINKNANLLCIADNVGTIPVVLALHYQRMDLFHTLYYATPMEVLLSGGGKHGATVISSCIKLKNSVVSTESAIKDDDFEFDNLFMLGSRFAGPPVESDTSNVNSAPTPLRWLVSKLVQLSGVYKRIEEQKSVHERSIKLLENMCKTIGFIKEESTLKDGLVFEALFEAVDEGNIKFVEEIMKANPVFAASSTDQLYSRDIYVRAIQSRHVDLFKHILQKVPGSQYVLQISAMPDKYGNKLLHEAARLPPSLSVPEAALQMQKELQWFEEVKKLLHPTASTDKNVDNLTPGELFTQNHKDLIIEGKKWMKETANSCSVVAALIVTMVFAAAFTVPGGEDHKIDRKLYNIFMISDGFSLFTSTTSVFMFLGILTSRFQEHDFHISLPRKLFIGLTILFLSIASMLITFCVVLLIMLPESWVPIPVILFASLPVTLFAFLQFPLLIRIFRSTYGRSFSLTSKPESTDKEKNN